MNGENMKHKHAETIHAWAEGAKLQFRIPPGETWQDVEIPSFLGHCEYRVKPAYPETTIGHSEMFDIYASYLRRNLGYTTVGAESGGLAAVANAAIRHAIEAGQVVPTPAASVK